VEDPGKPHVRLYVGFVYVERVPNYWVQVCPIDVYETLDMRERKYLISKALKKGHDTILPSPRGHSK
jgi:hypothetical protein